MYDRIYAPQTPACSRKRQYQERPPRFEYHLTKAGHGFRPVLLTLRQWGDRWAVDERATTFGHTCGEEVELVHTWGEEVELVHTCGGEVTGRDLRARHLTAAWAASASRNRVRGLQQLYAQACVAMARSGDLGQDNVYS